MISISLGYNCQPAITGVKLALRKTKLNGYNTCPFDECVTNYYGIILCLKENFKYFIDPNYLELYEAIENIGGCKKGEKLLCNTRYKFIFNHESPGHADLYISQKWKNGINHFIDNNYDLFIKRYEKRIENFRQYLSSGENINFLITRYIKNTNELENTLNELYPKLNYKIIFFETNETKESLIKHYELLKMNLIEINKEFDS